MVMHKQSKHIEPLSSVREQWNPPEIKFLSASQGPTLQANLSKGNNTLKPIMLNLQYTINIESLVNMYVVSTEGKKIIQWVAWAWA